MDVDGVEEGQMLSLALFQQGERQHSDLSTQPQCAMLETLGKVEG